MKNIKIIFRNVWNMEKRKTNMDDSDECGFDNHPILILIIRID